MDVIGILNKWTSEGVCPALVYDDNGHWAVSTSGFQPVPDGDAPITMQTTFFIEAADWRDSIEEAIQAVLDAHPEEREGERAVSTTGAQRARVAGIAGSWDAEVASVRRAVAAGTYTEEEMGHTLAQLPTDADALRAVLADSEELERLRAAWAKIDTSTVDSDGRPAAAALAPAEDGPRFRPAEDEVDLHHDPIHKEVGTGRAVRPVRAPAVERPSAEDGVRESDLAAVNREANMLWQSGHTVRALAYWRVLAAAREAERLREIVATGMGAIGAENERLRERVAALEAELHDARTVLHWIADGADANQLPADHYIRAARAALAAGKEEG